MLLFWLKFPPGALRTRGFLPELSKLCLGERSSSPGVAASSTPAILFLPESPQRPLFAPPRRVTLAFSIPNPTVSLAYMHSRRLATRVMATRPSCPEKNGTCRTPGWAGTPGGGAVGCLWGVCGVGGQPPRTMQSIRMNLRLSSLKAWCPFLS